MTGGIAPTTEPTQVLAMLTLFIGVYAIVYRRRLNAPKPAVNGFTPIAKIDKPKDPDTAANITACNGLKN